MKLASFDIEIAKEIPDDCKDWKTIAPLGISCAAMYIDDVTEPVEYLYGHPQLDPQEAELLVLKLRGLVRQGYTIVTWNGCGFDFAVLAQESGMLDECTELALNHVDLMLLLTFQRGYMLGLDKACVGARLKGKTHEVTLKSGIRLTKMEGSQAPRLWAAGEDVAVLTYLAGDVEQTNKLAHIISLTQQISWTSNSGKYNICHIDILRTVRECFDYPLPDTSWMNHPVTRKQFIDWMPEKIQQELLHEG